jgi:ABC-type transport system substrate-binding protein
VHYYSNDDIQKAVVPSHDYDILLYGISIGVDPDVFAYWDSSQASLSSQGHLNLSEYKSKAADQALESGRTRTDPELRATKYRGFLTAWANDVPALALYQPNSIYVSRGPVFNFERKAANTSADRFYNVKRVDDPPETRQFIRLVRQVCFAKANTRRDNSFHSFPPMQEARRDSC